MKINWIPECVICQERHNGECINPRCAEYHYDEWGDPIPSDVYYMDGNSRDEYIEKKRKEKRK